MINCCKDMITMQSILQSICKGCSEELEKEIFSAKFKVLLAIHNEKMISPKDLVRKLKIAKSNLAMFCKILISEGKIVDKKDANDHRVIYYNLTKSGETFINDKMKELQTFLEEKLSKEDAKLLKDSVENILKILLKVEGEKDA